GEQTLKWWCPQLSDTRGMTVKSVVPAAKGVKGRTNVDDPSIVGKCKRTRTKCGELPNECIVTSVDEVVCSSTGVKGDNCTGE
ncbi:MAG: hypothetical protein L6Q35_15210, partial [Phycisphaerales bacterium]|nr:hypothetical protein [Phycisphaerales bacterium]